MVSKSCLLGFLICIALLALLFGIDAISRDLRNRRQHVETLRYHSEAVCVIQTMSLRRTRTATGEVCSYAHYLLEFVTPNMTEFLGVRQSYSNFYDHQCGGFIATNASGGSVRGVHIPCWYDDPADSTVRVSPVFERDHKFIIYGSVLLIVGGLPVVVFVCYNCFLCFYVCCRSTEDDWEARRRQPQRPSDESRPARQMRSEPFEIKDVDEQEEGWIASFTRNSYARSIMCRLHKMRRKNKVTGVVIASSPSMAAASPHHSECADIEECQVCFDPVHVAVVVYPCGHHVCDECATRLLANSFYGIVSMVKCPCCREEYEDSALVRVKIADRSRTPAVVSTAPTPQVYTAEEGNSVEMDNQAAHSTPTSDPYATPAAIV